MVSTIVAPPSKAHTLRALFCAALADGKSTINNPLLAEDQLLAIDALKQFGVVINKTSNKVEVNGTGGKLKIPKKEVYVGNSGVTMRFLTAIATLCEPGETIIAGIERMKQRPIEELLETLKELGASAISIEGNGCPPVKVQGGGILGGSARLRSSRSSQFMSAILTIAPYASNDVTINLVTGMRSRPYVDLTIDVMNKFGVIVKPTKGMTYVVNSGKHYTATDFDVEGDYSSAGYFFAAAAITGKTVRVENLRQDSVQADKKLLDILEEMGCNVEIQENAVTVTGGNLKAVDVEMSNMPDAVPTLAVVSAFAEGKTKISDIDHLRLKESDRIASIIEGLNKMGITVEESADGIEITGGKPAAAEINSYNDHRIAMSFSVAGLVVPGVKVTNPESMNKSFPGFLKELEKVK